MPKEYNNTRQLALAMAAYSSASIFGPLLIFGALGYFLDKFFNTGHILLFIGIAAAFVATNVLLFMKVKALSKWTAERGKELKEKDTMKQNS